MQVVEIIWREKPVAAVTPACYSRQVCFCEVGSKVGPHLHGASRLLSGQTTYALLALVASDVSRTPLLGVGSFFCGARRDERKEFDIARNDGPRINEEITSRTCRLIGIDGSQMGLFGVRDALRIARDQGLDLVEIAPNAEPPVCKMLDYRKFKYEQDRKAKAARKNQAKVEVKEMKFRPKIDVGDYETKKGHVIRFLKKGARVKITIMFRGREMAHPEQGRMVLDRLAEDLKDVATVEQKPLMEGRNMHMTIVPIKGAFDEKPAAGDDTVTTEKEN